MNELLEQLNAEFKRRWPEYQVAVERFEAAQAAHAETAMALKLANAEYQKYTRGDAEYFRNCIQGLKEAANGTAP